MSAGPRRGGWGSLTSQNWTLTPSATPCPCPSSPRRQVSRRRCQQMPSREPAPAVHAACWMGKGPGVVMMPRPFPWRVPARSTGPLSKLRPIFVHATGSNKRVSSAPNSVQPHWTLPFYVTHCAVPCTRGTNSANASEHCERGRTPSAVYLFTANLPQGRHPVSIGVHCPPPNGGGAMYFAAAKSLRSVQTTQRWRTVIANS
jgi:hypothetical protein